MLFLVKYQNDPTQASNWKDCAQLLFQQKQLTEVHNQTLNQ